MNDVDLERQLGAMFERRATDIRTAPPIELGSSSGRRRLKLPPIAIAASVAAVVIAAGGTVVGIRSVHHSPRPTAAAPVTTSSSAASPSSSFLDPSHPVLGGVCMYTPPAPVQAWHTAIANGTKVALDHPDNQVVSVNGATADYLVLQSTPNDQRNAAVYGQWTLAVFRGAQGEDIVQSAAGELDSPVADASGAVAPDWITYGLAHPQQNGGFYKLQLVNRGSKADTTVDQVTDAQAALGRQFLGTPVIYDGSLYWLEGTHDQPATNVLKSYDLRSGARSSTPAAGAVGLFYYGDGLAILTGTGAGSAVVNRLGTPLPNWVLRQMVGASVLTYAGPSSATGGQANLSWLVTDSGSADGFYYWAEGANTSASDGGTAFNDLRLPTGAFAPYVGTDGTQQIVDDRAGVRNFGSQLIPLPESLSFQALVGSDLVFAANETKSGASGFVLVPVSSLPKPVDYPGC